jgi:hypothetical protein
MLFGMRSKVPLSAEILADWFLASGVWDSAGIWVDDIPYPDLPFFLASGSWNAGGFWIDDEVYP